MSSVEICFAAVCLMLRVFVVWLVLVFVLLVERALLDLVLVVYSVVSDVVVLVVCVVLAAVSVVVLVAVLVAVAVVVGVLKRFSALAVQSVVHVVNAASVVVYVALPNPYPS